RPPGSPCPPRCRRAFSGSTARARSTRSRSAHGSPWTRARPRSGSSLGCAPCHDPDRPGAIVGRSMKRDIAALDASGPDLLVIGGGIYGAAAAWDAAQRGLRVALVEGDDFGGGVPWNSRKPIHGGLRHLPHGDVASLRESMRDRRALLRIAPELVRPLGFLVPTRGWGAESRVALAAGLAINDLLAVDRNAGLTNEHRIPRGRVLSREEAFALVPGLPREGLAGAALWPDAQVVSSERLTLAFVHAAADAGAHVANHVEALRLSRLDDRVTGAAVRDTLTGEELIVQAHVVLVAAGPATGTLL